MNGQLREWTRDVATVLTQPSGIPQMKALAGWLRRLGHADHILQFAYPENAKPVSLFHTLPPGLRASFLEPYQLEAYLMDPLYLAALFDKEDGLYGLRDLAPDSFSGNPYFLTYYQHLQVSDELGYITSLEDGSKAVLSLMRGTGSPLFSEDEILLFGNAAPVVDEVTQTAWRVHRQVEPRQPWDLALRVRKVTERFGHGLLTRREHQVIRLILEGHSSRTIAEQLGIRCGTIKVHRRNIYDKLEIGSEAELYALFIRMLGEA
ncbi:helix-turn-helix transcriptional regulator [Pseudomonas sp. zfem005]|uniref:helix-turn-helix transcriptional regulator n=1 Tax=Pseudomonas sp. zfem005 TaxID=3078200 RepID=UPI002929FAB3|nr:helix-turn-helix transcriptional regulator [Pseudomonas sp. zfem005]MDU9414829.1 helix-turn-helix transcriptional regulator [Pseudomonas sp. zfem005]